MVNQLSIALDKECIFLRKMIPLTMWMVFVFFSVVTLNGEVAVVEVEQGWLRGELLETVTGDSWFWSFKGVPYARPPVGKLRFKAPRQPPPWNGIRNATAHGSICKQVGNANSSEDCLFLNVYSPNLCPDALLAVMVFVHGGSYLFGSGNDDLFGPDFLIDENVVVVTINYRLGPFGFLSLENEDAPGNAGLKDQVAAFKWVKRNIAAFGGDPDNVTIFGQSSGAAAVGYHLLSCKSKGLFIRAILMSGVPFCDFSIPFQSRRRAFVSGKLLGLETEDDKKLFKFLQNIDADKLASVRPTVLTFEDQVDQTPKVYSFLPVVEKALDEDSFLIEELDDILRKGDVNDVDIMFGYTNEEGLATIASQEDYIIRQYNKYPELYAPGKCLFHNTPSTILKQSDDIRKFYFGNSSLNKDTMIQFINYANNVTLVYDTQRFFNKFPKQKHNKMYFYEFSSFSDRNVFGKQGAKYGIKGAAHVDDLMYLFDAKIFNLPIKKNTTEYALVKQETAIFTNFAKFGNPTPNSKLGIIWPEYDNVKKKYVNIGQNLTVSAAPDRKDMEFWKFILESAGIPF